MGGARNDMRGLAMTWGACNEKESVRNDAVCFLSLRGTKQSLDVILMDCFAALAMTWGGLQ